MKLMKVAAAAVSVTMFAAVSAQAGPNDPPYTKHLSIAGGLCSDMVFEMKHWAAGADQWSAFASPTVPAGTRRCGPNRNKAVDVVVEGAATKLGAMIRAENSCNAHRPAGMGPCRVVGVVRNW